MSKPLCGGCLCGAVRYQLNDALQRLFLCHCKQCQRDSGTTHTSNAFSSPDSLQWLQGAQVVKRFDYPGRGFSKVFCSHCGSGLPYVTQNSKFLIVPVGTLDELPELPPTSHIFYHERMPLFDVMAQFEHSDGYPNS